MARSHDLGPHTQQTRNAVQGVSSRTGPVTVREPLEPIRPALMKGRAKAPRAPRRERRSEV